VLVDDRIDGTSRHRGVPHDWLTWSADAAFVLLVGATIVCFLVKANGLGFFADDWRLAQRGGSVGDYFQPYNDSLTVVPIAIYRALYATFGFRTAFPLRLVGVLSGASIAMAMFLVVRARVGTAAALVAGSALLWYPNFAVIPSTFDHYLALTAIVVCAWLLTREGLVADASLASVLTFALCNSGIGVVGGVGAMIYVALARAPLSRWVSVIVPMAAWTTWRLLMSQHTRGNGVHSPSRLIHFVFDGIAASFRGLVFNSSALAVLLATAFLITLCSRLRQGVRASRNEVAWSVVLVAWWVGLAYTRGALGTQAVRYDLAGSAFIVLAFLPTRVKTWRMLHQPVALAAGAAFAALVVLVNHGVIFENQRELALEYDGIRANLMVGNLDAAVVPDRVLLPVGGLAPLSAGEYRRLVAKFGRPPGTRAKDLDAAVVALGGVRPVVARADASGRCIELARPSPVSGGSSLTLRAGADDVALRLRRFDDASTDVGTIPAGSTAIIRLPGPEGTRPWIIEAQGACRVADVHVTITQPRAQARISGSTPLVATASGTVAIRTVDFRLTRGQHSNVTVLRAQRGYVGWVYTLDASQLPNGRYSITSVATDETGAQTESSGVPVTVDK
jgi:hypothetical protein